MSFLQKIRTKNNRFLFFTLFSILFLFLFFIGKDVKNTTTEIEYNPTGKTPLTAAIDITGNQSGELTIQVLGKGDDGITLKNTYTYTGDNARFPVVGLYSNYTNTILIELTDASGEILYSQKYSLQTPIISAIAKVQIDVKKTTVKDYQGLYTFVGSHAAFDAQGELRYFLNDDTLGNILSYLKDGNYLYEGNEEKIIYQKKYFYEVNIFGEKLKKYTIPKLYHHDVIEMENGNFLVLGNSQSFLTLTDPSYREDTILEIDRETGEEIKNIDFYKLMPELRPEKPEVFLGWTSTADWLHMNSVVLLSDTTALVSMKAYNAVAQINLETETLDWVLYENALNTNSIKDIALKAINITQGERFFPSGQHSAIINPSGNLILLDNGQKNPNSRGDDSLFGETRIVEYKIDAINKTIEKIWQYTPSPALYVEKQGSVRYTDEGNMLLGFTDTTGNTPKLQEFSPTGELLFEADEASGLKGNFYYRVYKWKYR